MKTLKKNYSINDLIKRMIFIIPLVLISMTLSAQDTNAYEKAKNEIKQHFGTVPSMFEAYPDYALAGAWENFKQLNGPQSKIPPKYRELIQLAVAAQIPCDYCIYFHVASAKGFGATDEEIQEAIAHGAQTRHWSMILKGNQVDFEEFKKEMNAMIKFMSEKSKK
ncbi:MAG: carboxymuconolactone decarboxylase family protein [Bacteroidota bacterium]